MKIGIITFHAAHNYGSMLQAYALQTYLEQQGHHVEIINFRSKYQKLMYSKPISFNNLHQIKKTIKLCLFDYSSLEVIKKKWYMFEDFLSKYLNMTVEYQSMDQLKKVHLNFDYIITGSDQIWNTKAKDFSEVYFGTFTSKIKKIAYAPSMGPEPELQDVLYIKSLLNGFKAISVREKRTKDFLENNDIYHPVEIVLDPTLLLDAKDYTKLYSEEPLVKGRYIFYYTPGCIRPEFMKIAEALGKKFNLPVITEGLYYPKDMKLYSCIKEYKAVGPSEFLNLIKNSEITCGASFHLMAFSLLFQKQFYCINGDVDSRMNNLMKLFNLEDKILSIKSPSGFNTNIINWGEVKNLLAKYRSSSVTFLQSYLV